MIGMIAAIAALPSELAGIRRHLQITGSSNASELRIEEGRLNGQDCLLVRSGMGRRRAEGALRYVLRHYHPSAVLSLGYCGALSASLRVGDLVLCSPVAALTALPSPSGRPVPLEDELSCDSALIEQARHATSRLEIGGCLTLPGVASDPHLKAWLSSSYPYSVVDMESFWLGVLAQEAGVPFVAVRSVSDTLTESLPPLDDLVDDFGRLQLKPMSRYLLSHPLGVRAFARLGLQAQRAQKALTDFTLSFLGS